jgi:hypothetical protein
MRKYLLAIVATVLMLVIAGRIKTVKADIPQDVAPYEFAHIPVEFHAVDVKVYKMVHQGCEIFVTTNSAMGHEAASIAIATGRGCK